MTETDVRNAIALHGVTARRCQRAASARGSSEEAERYAAIATAAEGGRLLAPTTHENNLHWLAAAQALNLVDGPVVENRGVQDAAQPLLARVGGNSLAPERPTGVEGAYPE
jgi:hypothetical protein